MIGLVLFVIVYSLLALIGVGVYEQRWKLAVADTATARRALAVEVRKVTLLSDAAESAERQAKADAVEAARRLRMPQDSAQVLGRDLKPGLALVGSEGGLSAIMSVAAKRVTTEHGQRAIDADAIYVVMRTGG